jgi:hypothetical protein
MNDKTKLVFKAFLELNSTEKVEIEKAIKEYNAKTLNEQRIFGDLLNKSLGPTLGAKCAVCGK